LPSKATSAERDALRWTSISAGVGGRGQRAQRLGGAELADRPAGAAALV
jgi:hypothetical protein